MIGMEIFIKNENFKSKYLYLILKFIKDFFYRLFYLKFLILRSR